MEPRTVERSNLDDLFRIPESRIVQSQFQTWAEKSPFLPNPAWVGISVPCNQDSQVIQVANKADPASALMEFTVKWERQVLSKELQV